MIEGALVFAIYLLQMARDAGWMFWLSAAMMLGGPILALYLTRNLA